MLSFDLRTLRIDNFWIRLHFFNYCHINFWIVIYEAFAQVKWPFRFAKVPFISGIVCPLHVCMFLLFVAFECFQRAEYLMTKTTWPVIYQFFQCLFVLYFPLFLNGGLDLLLKILFGLLFKIPALVCLIFPVILQLTVVTLVS